MITGLKLPQPRTPSARAAEQLGARIRLARKELGLSLAALAGSDLSRAFVNQIELGRATPSMRTMQMLAERLQRPIEYFLQDPDVSTTALELALTEAQTRLQRGDVNASFALVSGLLARPRLPAEFATRAQILMVEVHLRRGDGQLAIPIIEEALRTAEAKHWPLLSAELCDRMGSVYYGQRRAHEAGRWFDRALSTYEAGGLSDPPLKARILGHRANLRYVMGEATDAITDYQAAIEAAEGVLDMQGLAGIYEGLALSFQKTGQKERALTYAQRSLRLFEALQNVRMSAQLRNNMAEILLEQGRPQEAERLFKEGAAQLRRAGDTDLLPHLLGGSAEAALNMGELRRASARIRAASAAAEASSDPLARMGAQRISGKIAFALGRMQDARAHFDRALEIAAAMKGTVTTSRVLYDYARVLEANGNHLEAAARYREAYDQGRKRPTDASIR